MAEGNDVLLAAVKPASRAIPDGIMWGCCCIIVGLCCGGMGVSGGIELALARDTEEWCRASCGCVWSDDECKSLSRTPADRAWGDEFADTLTSLVPS